MSREAMQLALEALESDPTSHAGLVSRKQAIAALRQALDKEWVGLTDEEHDSIKHNYHNMTWTLEMFARAIEQALKEKNHG